MSLVDGGREEKGEFERRHYRVGAVNTLWLFAEGELFLAAEHLVDTLAIKDGNFWPKSLQFFEKYTASISNFLSCKIGAPFCRSGYHICKADTKMKQLEVVIGRHGLRYKSGKK